MEERFKRFAEGKPLTVENSQAGAPDVKEFLKIAGIGREFSGASATHSGAAWTPVIK